MNQSQIQLFDHKKPIKLQAKRVSFYQQAKIIEAYSDNNEVYYLFFYKNHFITAAKTTKLRRQSYIEHALKEGIVINSPHPLINQLLATNFPCQIITFKQLLKKLATHFTPQENAFILTFFESFFPRQQLFDEIKSKFYEYRRNGQMYLACQIVRILMDFVPNHSLVRTLANDKIFIKYAGLYEKKSEEIFAKDSLFFEKTMFLQKENDQSFQQLVIIMKKESRWMDMIALYIYKLTLTPSVQYYTPLLTLLDQHFKQVDIEIILEELSYQLPSYLPLQQDLLEMYVKNREIEKFFTMINSSNFQINNSHIPAFRDMLEHLDTTGSYSLEPEMLTNFLIPIIQLYPEDAEKLLKTSVISLLKTHDLAYLKKWLDQLKGTHEHFQIFEEIETMHSFSEDLDQMQKLGELYYKFRQWEKAIECFSWEMELHPTDPKPLQWLSKVYRKMGMNQESETYLQLCVNLKKWA